MLRDNYAQNIALANAARPGARACSTSTSASCAAWSATGQLDRALEFLPTDRQIRERLGSPPRPDLERGAFGVRRSRSGPRSA